MTKSDAGRLDGQVVLVTGAAQGIGEAIAEVAAREGARVGIVDVDPRGADVANRLAEASFAQADITAADQIATAVAKVASALGTITVLINNAGRNAYFDPVTMTSQQWDDVFAVDLKAVWLCCREVLPEMISQRRGSIINIASLHARLTAAGMFPYAAAKAGLVGLTRSLALEVAPHGIRVNAVSPGYVRTQLMQEYLERSGDPDLEQRTLAVHPLGRIGTPRDVAEVVCFLASSAAGFVTGADWPVDGGIGARFA